LPVSWNRPGTAGWIPFGNGILPPGGILSYFHVGPQGSGMTTLPSFCW
jgi:hypothetical protein